MGVDAIEEQPIQHACDFQDLMVLVAPVVLRVRHLR